MAATVYFMLSIALNKNTDLPQSAAAGHGGALLTIAAASATKLNKTGREESHGKRAARRAGSQVISPRRFCPDARHVQPRGGRYASPGDEGGQGHGRSCV